MPPTDPKTTDILALLRTWDSPVHPDNIRAEAAREIERLRAILDSPPTDAMIRAALDEPQAGDESMYHRIWRAMVREAANAR